MSFSYATAENRSFVLAQARPYIACMKNRELQYRYPTPAELYAVERAAKAARAAEVARLAGIAVNRLKSLFTAQHSKGLKHA
jgi:hypothetical protein